MALIALIISALVVGQSLAYPLGWGGGDWCGGGCCDNWCGGGCCDNWCGGGWCGNWGDNCCGGGWCGNWGDNCCGGGWCGNWGDNWCGGGRSCGNWGGYGYPPSTSYARENYVRPSWNGPEFGTRNEVTYRPGYYGGPYSPFYGPWA